MRSIAGLEGLEETLEILSDKSLTGRIQAARTELETGTTEQLDKSQAQALIRGR